jgi:hypothetical protein
MGELAAWIIGFGLGFTTRDVPASPLRIGVLAIAVCLLGGAVTLASGEMADEPWLDLIDIAQVAIAAGLGRYALSLAVRIKGTFARGAR